ncbi:MAG TPA: efflux RND transporter periplasmic adaptor subunit [Luteimonas sp.]|nr:efflux RND transporter periplasmic adaptor subunit [Luteimonas sp.]
MAPLLLCVMAGSVLALGACTVKKGDGAADKDGADKGPDAVPVEVATLGRRAIAASYAGTAPLEARADAQVVAKTSGVALQVMVEEGQRVRAGQVLVRLDADRPRLQEAQSAAQVSKLEANYARSLKLSEQSLISAYDIDQLKYDLQNARAANRLAQLELSYTEVRAPISGVIASRSIKTGNFVQINTPIFRIIDADRLEATLNVPERELATMHAGLPVSLQVDALPGKTFTGSIDRVSPVVDSGSGTFRVVCAFDNAGVLQPGMFGRVRVDYASRADALALPRSALLEDEAKPAVFVVRGGKAMRATLVLGYTEGEWAEVRGGLKQGDQVVVAGKSAVRDGSVVQVIAIDGKTVAVPAAAKDKGTDKAGDGKGAR